MLKKITCYFLVGIILGVFISCQQIFTYSPLEILARNPDSLPDDQKEAFAESALESGDSDAIETALDLITGLLGTSTPTPESVTSQEDLYLLAADLAISASGVDDALIAFINGEADPMDILESIDQDSLDIAVDMILTVLDNVEEPDIDSSQYVMAGVGLLLAAASDAGGIDSLGSLSEGDLGYDDLQQGLDLISEGIDDLTAALGLDIDLDNPEDILSAFL